MMMSDEAIRQIDELARSFSKTRSEIVRLAIARWHRVEFPQKEEL
jgi:predicted transcriptional regulator